MNLYGLNFKTDNRIEVEMAFVKGGGTITSQGKTHGLGLFEHYKRLMSLLWPDDDWHRWNELFLKSVIKHRIIGVLGPASSGKTHEAAKFALATYWTWPTETTILCSSTTREMLNMRIWGEIVKMRAKALKVCPNLAGDLIESRQRIVTYDMETDGRDFRNGIVGLPAKKGEHYVGLGDYVGIKNKRVMLIADELQFMPRTFLDCIPNLAKNSGADGMGFKAIGMGNPKDRTDALGKMCEPSDETGGWDGVEQNEKTKTWTTRFMGGLAVQLVGTDSPNYDEPKNRYPYLIKESDIEADRRFYGGTDIRFSMMDLGMMPMDSQEKRVITRSICTKFKAMEDVTWEGTEITKVAGLDAAYSGVGGDRCVFCELWFGRDKYGHLTLWFRGRPFIIPVSGRTLLLPEEQIAQEVRRQCELRGIPPENFGYDATGRGTLAVHLARIWSAAVNPIEFGGKPTDRMVSDQMRIPCSMYYGKFVTELWYSVRLIIESGQFRGLPDEVMEEGCLRAWDIFDGNKIDVEPKKDMKIRLGRSPDLFDALVCAVEMARRKGFKIEAGGESGKGDQSSWLDGIQKRCKELKRQRELRYA